ncbi:nucleoid-associated protein [Intestinibacter bartlettii]|uniref:nucleoid-associated protein n=1 Tax=Intestinibacter bartlettii TaxID=261299 RepID=UPI00403D9022
MIIDKFIVHMLDINLDKPMLADFIGKDYSDVDKFLKKLITKCQKHDETMRAKWKYAEEFIQDCCKNIFEDENIFTNASKQIAAHYYDLMKNNNILEPVTLVICQYTVNATQNIAIMRLENKKTYSTTVDLIEDKFNINIIENKKTISTALKQCALIHEDNLMSLYDLVILDKESSEESIFKDFLKAEIIRDDTYKTRVFIDIAQMYIDVGFKKMDKKEAAIKTLECMLDTTSNMDINKFIDLSGIDADIKKTLEKYDIYDSFNIDKKVVEKEFKVRSIKTDTGFVIKNKFNAFRDSSKYRIVNNPDGTTDLLIKNIQYFKEG